MELFIGRNINLLDIVFFIKNICNVIIKYLKTNCFFLPIYRKQETRYELHSYQDKINEKLYQEVLDLFDLLCVTSTDLFFLSINLLFHQLINIHFLILSVFFFQRRFNYIIILYFYLNKKFLFFFYFIFLNKKFFIFF